MKWDREEEGRNRFAWYLHAGGGRASDWNLREGAWADVNAVVDFPTMWGPNPSPELAEGAILVLDKCRDNTTANRGSALFVETMIGEIHPVRSVIEAYSKTARLHGSEASDACGYDFRKGLNSIGQFLRVWSGSRRFDFKIDRWD